MNFVKSEVEAKLVVKPWGFANIGGVSAVGETWLNFSKDEEVGQEEKRYVLKRIYIKAGTRSSLQLHHKKMETNYVVSGSAEIWLENEYGKIEKELAEPGNFFTVPCGRKHRVVALTDLIMLEASTPEVDDVIRFQDDAGRPDGRIESEHKS